MYIIKYLTGNGKSYRKEQGIVIIPIWDNPVCQQNDEVITSFDTDKVFILFQSPL